jgi:3-hydroxyacyl-[acyl-carrier-protein] dehydratase
MKLAEIKEIIPHREPFIFLDEIIELISLKHAVGKKYVKDSEPFFQGHFPGQPVMPGVLIIEALAQLGAVVLLSHPKYHGKIAYFTGIKNAKFRRSVLPGDTLTLYCELTKIRGNFGFGVAKAYIEEELVCQADISFATS